MYNSQALEVVTIFIQLALQMTKQGVLARKTHFLAHAAADDGYNSVTLSAFDVLVSAVDVLAAGNDVIVSWFSRTTEVNADIITDYFQSHCFL